MSAGSDDEEEDYMSDKFLSGEVRPSLIQHHNKKRQVEIEVRQQEHVKRQRQESAARKGVMGNEQLQEALQRPIAAQNKGFQLLAKMGYKPGQALGKPSSSDVEGDAAGAGKAKRLIEPIGISIKTDRGGLGREAALRELAERRRQLRAQHLRGTNDAEISTEAFRRRAQQKADERFTAGALKSCQLSCETLDMAAGIQQPDMCWFWPTREVSTDANDTDEEEQPQKEAVETAAEAEDEYTPAEQLELLTNYLRTAYKFCFWCGVHYADQTDLGNNCPGETRDEH